MAMFLLHIAFLLALGLFGAGLFLWHRGAQPTADVLRIGGGILVVGAILSALCVGYYGIRYQVQGDFDHAYAVHPPMDMGRMMGPGGMMGRGGMMGGAMKGRPEMGRPEAGEEMARPPVSDSEHEAHHPEGAAPR